MCAGMPPVSTTRRAPDERRTHGDETSLAQQLGGDVALRQRTEFVERIVIVLITAGREAKGPTVNQSDIARIGERALLFELAGQPEVVLIEKGQPFALRLVNGRVPRLPERSLLWRKEVANTRVAEFSDDRRAVVGRAVVPRNQFPVTRTSGPSHFRAPRAAWRPHFERS